MKISAVVFSAAAMLTSPGTSRTTSIADSDSGAAVRFTVALSTSPLYRVSRLAADTVWMGAIGGLPDTDTQPRRHGSGQLGGSWYCSTLALGEMEGR